MEILRRIRKRDFLPMNLDRNESHVAASFLNYSILTRHVRALDNSIQFQRQYRDWLRSRAARRAAYSDECDNRCETMPTWIGRPADSFSSVTDNFKVPCCFPRIDLGWKGEHINKRKVRSLRNQVRNRRGEIYEEEKREPGVPNFDVSQIYRRGDLYACSVWSRTAAQRRTLVSFSSTKTNVNLRRRIYLTCHAAMYIYICIYRLVDLSSRTLIYFTATSCWLL